PCSLARAQLNQKRAKESDTNNRHRMPGLHLCAAADMPCTAQRSPWERSCRSRLRQDHHLTGVGNIRVGECVIGQPGDALARPHIGHSVSNCLDPPPSLVPRGTGLQRISKPRPPLPNREVGTTDATAFHAYSDLRPPHIGCTTTLDPDPPGRRQHSRSLVDWHRRVHQTVRPRSASSSRASSARSTATCPSSQDANSVSPRSSVTTGSYPST